MIYTVFPYDEDAVAQDFDTYDEAENYAEEWFSESGYEIQATTGDVV